MHEIKCPNCGEVFTVDESGYAAIVGQVRDSEFNKQLLEREKHILAEKEQELKLAEANAKIEKEKSLADLKQEIEHLKALVASGEKDMTIAVNEVITVKKDEIVEKDKKITELQSKLSESQKDSQLKIQSLKENYEVQLKAKDETVEFYKDLKTRMSTKMVGETLEQHCEIEFNKLRATGFKNAYFEKDNDSRTGSKGDYIF